MRYARNIDGHKVVTIFNPIKTELMGIDGGTVCFFYDQTNMVHMLYTSSPIYEMTTLAEGWRRTDTKTDIDLIEWGMRFHDAIRVTNSFEGVRYLTPYDISQIQIDIRERKEKVYGKSETDHKR